MRRLVFLLWFATAVYSADCRRATPPVGHACMGGGIAPVQSMVERLQARGFVLSGAEKPVVVISFDWCEDLRDWTRVPLGSEQVMKRPMNEVLSAKP